MVTNILIALAVLLVIFLVVAALQPADFKIERSIGISAPAAFAFGQVNDLHKWQEMSPYAKHDRAAKYTFTGPAAGVGAAMAWTGNSKVGEGRITITGSRPGELVAMKLEFVRPFKCNNDVAFSFRQEGGQTRATWGMSGRNNLFSKAMGLVINMDKMVGGQFDEGLASMKALAEAAAEKQEPAGVSRG
jgi:hypothetical protein